MSHSEGVTDALRPKSEPESNAPWRKHAFGLWTLAVIDGLLLLAALAVALSGDEDTDIFALLASALLTVVGVIIGLVMLFRTLGTYGELSGSTWPKVVRVLVVVLLAVGVLYLLAMLTSL